MKTLIISIGSNIEPKNNLRRSIKILKEYFKVLSLSKFYESPPYNRPEQQNFINCAILITTNKDYSEIKKILRIIETRLNRVRTEDKFAARTIDLDITVEIDESWEQSVQVFEDNFYLHPFVALPIADIIPNLKIKNTTLIEIISEMDKSQINKIDFEIDESHQ